MQVEEDIKKNGNGGIEKVLRMAGEDLHDHGPYPDEQPPRGRAFQQSVYGQQDEGCPGHRTNIDLVSREDVHEIGPGEHDQESGGHTGGRMEPPVGAPEIHEKSDEKDMDGNGNIQGRGDG